MILDGNDIKVKIVADDYTAFKELYLLMYASLKRFAAIYAHDEHLAEDVLADVFLKLWDRRKQLTEVENLRVYLYTAVKNTAINYRMKQSRITEEADDYSFYNDTNPDPENALISSEAQKAIQKAINDLPPRCKLIFRLAKEEGLRYKEIASILGISIKTIDNQLAIAIQKIGEAILSRNRQKVG
ncbi:MAG: RNA polymerase sigma-70 factor [Chitinophagaceae bacterium]